MQTQHQNPESVSGLIEEIERENEILSQERKKNFEQIEAILWRFAWKKPEIKGQIIDLIQQRKRICP